MRNVTLAVSALLGTLTLTFSVESHATPAAPSFSGIQALPSGGATIRGYAAGAATITLFTDAACTAALGPTGQAIGGAFAIDVPTPTATTSYWAEATTGAKASPCSSQSITFAADHAECPAVPDDLPISLAPVFWQESSMSAYYYAHVDPPIFQSYLSELREDRFAVVGPFGFAGEGGLYESQGAVYGYGDTQALRSYGGGTSFSAGGVIDEGIPTADEILTRVGEHRAYMANFNGVTNAFNYADMGSQIMGNHWTCVADPVTHVASGPGCTGFWNFYWNQWSAYETAGLVGARPSDPTSWLLRSDDPLFNSTSNPHLAGLTFLYGQSPDNHSYVRYSVNIASQGWADFWSDLFSVNARSGFRASFIDNVVFQNCWNDECQQAYRDYLSAHYTSADIGRIFTVSHGKPYLLPDRDNSFERAWIHNTDGTWTYQAGGHVMIDGGVEAPDTDSYGGLYSVRILGGGLQLSTMPSGTDPGALALKHAEVDMTFHYRTDCPADARLNVTITGATYTSQEYVLPASATWTSKKVRVHTEEGFYPTFYAPTTSGCHLWLDEIWMSDVVIDSLTPDASFETQWYDASPYGERTYYLVSYGAVVHRDTTERYDGASSARIEGGAMAVYGTDVAQADGYYDMSLHYKTPAVEPAQVTIWSGSTPLVVPLPASTTWQTVTRRVLVKAGTVLEPVYETPTTMWVDDTWTRRVDQPSLLPNAGFELGWYEDTQGWYTYYQLATPRSCVSPDTDAYSGTYSARIAGGSLGFQATSAAAVDTYYDLTVHYKTSTGAQAEVMTWTGGVPTHHALPDTSAWATVTLRVPIVRYQNVYPEFAATGTLWIDDILLTEGDTSWLQGVDPYPTFEVGLPSHAVPGEDVARQTAALGSWHSILEDRVQFLHDSASEAAGADYEIFANSGAPIRGAKYFMRERAALQAEVTYMPETAYAPGVYEVGDGKRSLSSMSVTAPVLESNVFDLKLAHGRRFVDEFNYDLHLPASPRQVYDAAAYTHNVDSVTLAHAEAAAFGGGAGTDLGLWTADYWLYPNRTPLRASSNVFHDFVDAHGDLYSCLTSTAEVGLVFHDLADDVAARRAIRLLAGGPTQSDVGLAGHGVTWDVLPLERVTPTNVARFKVLLLSGVDRVSEAEARTLLDFVRAGGTVITSGPVAALDELGRQRAAYTRTLWPALPTGLADQTIGGGHFISSSTDLTAATLMPILASRLGRTVVGAFPSAGPTTEASLRIATWRGYQREVVHVVNYAVPMGPANGGRVTPISNLVVRVPAPVGWTPTTAEIWSPEGLVLAHGPIETGMVSARVTVADGMATFTMPSVRIYTVADLKPTERAPPPGHQGR